MASFISYLEPIALSQSDVLSIVVKGVALLVALALLFGYFSECKPILPL